MASLYNKSAQEVASSNSNSNSGDKSRFSRRRGYQNFKSQLASRTIASEDSACPSNNESISNSSIANASVTNVLPDSPSNSVYQKSARKSRTMMAHSFSIDSAIGATSTSSNGPTISSLAIFTDEKSQSAVSKASASASGSSKCKTSASNDRLKKSATGRETLSRSSYGSLIVRNYLHKFYDTEKFGNDQAEEIQLILNDEEERARCNANCWKTFVWIGFALILIGLVLILIGYSFPRRHIIVLNYNEIETTHQAESFNNRLELCKLAGLVLFCVGGVCTVLGLLVPMIFNSSLLSHRLPRGASSGKFCCLPVEAETRGSSQVELNAQLRQSSSISSNLPATVVAPSSISVETSTTKAKSSENSNSNSNNNS